MELKTEGIILKVSPFQDSHFLVTVFTEKEGMIRCIVKGTKKASPSFMTPFSVMEFIFSKGNSDLLKCQEFSLLQQNLALRNSLQALQAAGEISQAVLKTKVQFQIDVNLYRLFTSYLRNLSKMKDPFFLVASFYLKMLQLEGLLPAEANDFTTEEQEIISRLLTFRTYSEIAQEALDTTLRFKLRNLFYEQIAQ